MGKTILAVEGLCAGRGCCTSTMSRGGSGYQSGGTNPFGDEQLLSDDQQYGILQRDVTQALRSFSANTNTLTKLVSSVNPRTDDRDLRNRIHDLIDQNKRLARDTTQKLKQMQSMKALDQREQNSRRAAQSKLAQDFQRWLQKFQEISTLDLNKERKEVQESNYQRGHGDFPGLGLDFDKKRPAEEEESLVQAQAMEDDIQFNEQIVQERNREIREIETAVVEVGQIFQDLAAMVNEQGVMVDNIEANISSSVEATSTGVVQLEGAEEYQIRARKKCVCISIIVVVAVAIIVIVILFALKVI